MGRFVRAVGYPPCKDEDMESFDCIKYGFDTDASALIDLVSFEYKRVPRAESDALGSDTDIGEKYPTRSTQTFAVGSGALIFNDDVGSKEENFNDEEDGENSENMFGGGSCSATKPSCGANYEASGPTEMPAVAAVSIVIDKNWGHEDYTCLYR